MKDEILAAVLFLVRFIQKTEKFPNDKLETFKKQLMELLTERFQDHWFPDCPAKGQGYRCIRVNELSPVDVTLKKAAIQSGIPYEDLRLPIELTLWVDPNEVCCRFGESEGSYCTLANFSDKENHMMVSDQLDRVLTCSPQSDDSGNISDSSFESVGGSSGTGSPPKSSMYLSSDSDNKRTTRQRKNRYGRGTFASNAYLDKQTSRPNANQKNGHRGIPVQRLPWKNNWYGASPPYANSATTSPNSYGGYRQTSYGRAATGAHALNATSV